MTTETTAYDVKLTAAQIFGFGDLVRRLAAADKPQDGDSPLRQELVDALNGFLGLLPEPSDADVDAYVAAKRAGEVPNWDKDTLPLTETSAEWVARVHPQYAPKAA